MKLYYFGMPGRAEASRIMLTTKDKPFEDVEFTGEQWGATYRAMSPNNKAPFLQLDDDGGLLTQTSAINRYIARLTGYYPEQGLVLGARTDELVMCMDDALDPVVAAYRMSGDEEKLAFIKKATAEGGEAYQKLAIVEKMLAAKAGNFFAGDEITLADIVVFSIASLFRSGMLPGLDDSTLSSFPNITALRKAVAESPKIKARYANAEGLRLAYKP